MLQRSISKRKSGYTLLELALVTALLVAVSSMSFPTVLSMYARYRVDAGIDSVRAGWAEARAQAVKEGRPYRFAVVMGKSNYRVAPDREGYWSGSGPSDDPEGKGLVLERAMPQGVVFASPGDAAPTTSDTVLPAGQVSPDQWSLVAVFQPDGTAREDVEITFSLKGTGPRVVQLRAMTGVVTVKSQGTN